MRTFVLHLGKVEELGLEEWERGPEEGKEGDRDKGRDHVCVPDCTPNSGKARHRQAISKDWFVELLMQPLGLSLNTQSWKDDGLKSDLGGAF